jgi:predicted metal-dependent peptidase
LSSAIRLALADSAGAVDYRYSRPSRRQSVFGGVVMPALRQPVPRVAVIVDTSGSISRYMLDTSLAEIGGILRAVGQREGVHVLAVDSAVQSCARVFASSQVILKGGGGTDMAAGLAAAGRLRPPPDIAIVVTDGFTPWPAQAPRGMQTVVVRLDPRGTVPPWARCVDADAAAEPS